MHLGLEWEADARTNYLENRLRFSLAWVDCLSVFLVDSDLYLNPRLHFPTWINPALPWQLLANDSCSELLPGPLWKPPLRPPRTIGPSHPGAFSPSDLPWVSCPLESEPLLRSLQSFIPAGHPVTTRRVSGALVLGTNSKANALVPSHKNPTTGRKFSGQAPWVCSMARCSRKTPYREAVTQ